jgi:hypothetical protein
MLTEKIRLQSGGAARWYFQIESKLPLQMRDGTKTSSGYLDFGGGRGCGRSCGAARGCLLSLTVLFVLSYFLPGFLPRPESLGSWLIAVYLILFPLLCGMDGGFFGFPLCAIWLDQRRQALRFNSLPPEN